MLSRSAASSSRQRSRCLATSRCLSLPPSSPALFVVTVSPRRSYLSRSSLAPSSPSSSVVRPSRRSMGLIQKEAFPPAKTIPPPVWTKSPPHPSPVSAIEAPLSSTKALLVPTAPANPSYFIPLAPSAPHRAMQEADKNLPATQRLPRVMWYYMKFLYEGFKVTYAESGQRTRIMNGIQDGGDTLTWREMQFCDRVRKDRFKMVPFLLVALTLEELIPFILLLFPNALPTTTLLPSQTLKMYEAKEAKLMKARQAVYDIMQSGKVDQNGQAQLELGWNAEAWTDWSREDQVLMLKVFGKSQGVPLKAYVEGKMLNVLNEIQQEDDHIMLRPPQEGLTREEFCVLLSKRGLLVNALPSEALPLILHDYLQARRTDARFSPFAYAVNDISLNQPRLVAAAASLLASQPTMASVNKDKGPLGYAEIVSDKIEEWAGFRLDGKPNKLVGIELAKEAREKVGGGEVKVLEEGRVRKERVVGLVEEGPMVYAAPKKEDGERKVAGGAGGGEGKIEV